MTFTNHLRAADFDPNRIPDEDTPVSSMAGMVRLTRIKAVVDPKTGKRTPEDTELVRRFKESGVSEESMLDPAQMPSAVSRESKPIQIPESLKIQGYKASQGSDRATRLHLVRGMTSKEVVELTRWDVFHDVSGKAPMLSLNYIWVAAFVMMMFEKVEVDVKALRNPLYMEAYESGAPPEISSRMALVLLALSEENEECLRTIGGIFEESRTGFMKHMYWDDIDTMESRVAKAKKNRDECPVM